MTNLDRLMIERECERLVSLYTHYADFGKAERVAELFAQDAVWAVGPIRFEGQEKIRQMMRGRQEMAGRRSRHVCTNLQIDVLDENNASGLVYLTLYRHDFEGPEREARVQLAGPGPSRTFRKDRLRALVLNSTQLFVSVRTSRILAAPNAPPR